MSYERDALAAEGRVLREALDESLGWMEHATLFIATRQKMHKTGRDLFDGAMRAGFAALKASPLTTAEVARVKRLAAVLEAAEEYRDAEQVQMLNEFKYDEPKYERQRKAKAALDAAIAAYRQSERPGVKP